MAARSKAWVYGRSLVGFAGSNPAGNVIHRRPADHSSRGVLPSVESV